MKYWLAVLLIVPTLAMAQTEWKSQRQGQNRGDISTFSRPVADNPLNAFKGVTEVPHPILHLLAVMADVERMPEWVFQCHAAQLLSQFGDNVAHIHIKGIWPVSDRDAVTRTTISQSASGTLTLHTRSANDIEYALEGAVRIPSIDNLFIFEPLADGWTRITFETQVDPGGKIPAWLANFVATRAPLVTLEGMQKMLQDPQYHLNNAEEFQKKYPHTGLVDGVTL